MANFVDVFIGKKASFEAFGYFYHSEGYAIDPKVTMSISLRMPFLGSKRGDNPRLVSFIVRLSFLAVIFIGFKFPAPAI